MKYTLKALVAIIFMASSIILGHLFLREPETFLLKRQIIDYYLSVYQAARNRPRNCTIAFGYTGCEDRKVDALELISKLNASFTSNQKSRLLTLQDFVETFAFYYKAGAATELFMENKQTFDELLSIVKNLPYHSTFGGHAPHMALRAANENCNAVLVARIGEQEVQEIKRLDQNSKITFVGNTNGGSDSDIHLIFEYPAGKYRNISSPRANRFYLNHDVWSANLSTLEEYTSAVTKMQVKRHAVAGFQMTQTLSTEKALQRLESVSKQWEKLRANDPQTIHLELAAFTNYQLYDMFVNSLVVNADSLGANEQETQALHQFLKHKILPSVANPYPKVEDMLTQLYEIIEELEKRNSTINRIHAHGVSEHYLCYKGMYIRAKLIEDMWEEGVESLVAGIVTAYTMCCNTSSIAYSDVKLFYEDFTNIQEKIKLSNLSFKKDSLPITKVQRGKWICLSGLNLVCQCMKKLAGLGDNISSAGFVYHYMKGDVQSQEQAQDRYIFQLM
eukprot:TRINITY_DN4865_c5_g1_i1.p1 TRINITY_DN4865_c5_g1~~TRINITY_DN4865_c5_g1_i1.p1  ORF type:complete len:504 (+),score=49.64 TRINITY_DN4865_c5_g1_i1:163-1674(+)